MYKYFAIARKTKNMLLILTLYIKPFKHNIYHKSRLKTVLKFLIQSVCVPQPKPIQEKPKDIMNICHLF